MGIWRSLLRTSIWVFPAQLFVAPGRAIRSSGTVLRTTPPLPTFAPERPLSAAAAPIPNTSKILSHRDLSINFVNKYVLPREASCLLSLFNRL